MTHTSIQIPLELKNLIDNLIEIHDAGDQAIIENIIAFAEAMMIE